MNDLPNILICGKMCSGKSTICTLIRDIFPQYKHVAFASKVKEIAKDLFFMDKDVKDRELLISIGSKMREINPDVWVDYVLKTHKLDEHIIIDDLRYYNEYEKIINADGRKWFLIYIKISPELQLDRLKTTYPENWQDHLNNINHHSETLDYDKLNYNLIINMDYNMFVYKNIDDFNKYYTGILTNCLKKNTKIY